MITKVRQWNINGYSHHNILHMTSKSYYLSNIHIINIQIKLFRNSASYLIVINEKPKSGKNL